MSHILMIKIKDIISKTFINSYDLFKIMIPIVIIVKILQELNTLGYLVFPFHFLMDFIGLPSVYAIVWLVCIFNTCYAAFPLIILFFAESPLTYEQLTTLSLVILIAHSLFIESAICYKLKVNPYWIAFIRLFSAIIIGFLFHNFAQYFNVMQETVDNFIINEALNTASNFSMTLLDIINSGEFTYYWNQWLMELALWGIAQLKIIFTIVGVIFIIFLLVRIFKDLQLLELMAKPFKPVLSFMRISKNNTVIVVICYIIGLSYGYGLLKEESKNSIFFRRDQAVKSLTFISIAHAMIEDLLLFAILGANFWVLLILRSLVAIVVVYILAIFVLPKISKKWKNKIFMAK